MIPTKETTDFSNPAGTKGFAFLEYVSEKPEQLRQLFTDMNLTCIGKHRSKAIELWQQGEIYFLLNSDPDGFAATFRNAHGPSVPGMAFAVEDAATALAHCLQHGAVRYTATEADWFDERVCVIRGIGDNLLFLVDDALDWNTWFEIDANLAEQAATAPKLINIDHVTHNVYKGNMDKWARFYVDLFNFYQIRYFDIQGKFTGLHSRALTSPCGKISIPINEPTDEQSQIQEYLDLYQGEGIQHIALSTSDIYQTVEDLQLKGMRFLDTPLTYYRLVDERLPGHGEPLQRMQDDRVLIDGSTKGGNVETLLQIFTETVIGPVFFEIIQRKGDEGFGEGNFQALFDSMELDQIERGVINPAE